jgi:hypothetical protein
MTLRVEDSRKLLVKLVGTEQSLGQAGVVQMFRVFLMARAKPYLAETMQKSEFGIFEVDSHMDELSEALHKRLMPDFKDYGLSLERFFITTIVKPDGDKAYESFKDLWVRKYTDVANAELRQQVGVIDQETDAKKLVIESQALATKRVQEGYNYQTERGFDVAEKVAQNEGSGNFASAGIGLGMMGGVAGGMGGMVAGITTNAFSSVAPPQGGVGTEGAAVPPIAGVGIVQPVGGVQPGAPAQPGTPPADDVTAFKHKLEKLKAMQEAGVLSAEEFEEEKKKLLSSI